MKREKSGVKRKILHIVVIRRNLLGIMMILLANLLGHPHQFLIRKAANYTLYVPVLRDKEQCRNRLDVSGGSKSLVFVHINLQYLNTAFILVGKSL